MTRDLTDRQRVVVTGLGIISPLGRTKEEVWGSLLHGHGVSGAGEVPGFHKGVDDFSVLPEATQKASRKSLKLMNRETRLGVAAAQQALSDSELDSAGYDPERIGVCFGVGNVSVLPGDFREAMEACTGDDGHPFDFQRWGEEGLPQVAPLWILFCLPNMPACHLSISKELRGPNNSITQEDAALNLAMAEARNLLAEGAAEAMVVGGTGTNLLPFNRLHAAMQNELCDAEGTDSVCRPFDRHRCGTVPAEGAAAFVLETLEGARSRGARVYGEILGAASSCVVEEDGAASLDQAAANAMRGALDRAGISPEAVGHVHAHGLGTQVSDRAEASAIRAVFGEATDRLPVVAAKSYTGNAGAGSGAIELATSLLALEHGHLFPVLNHQEADPECPIHPVTSRDVAAGDSLLNLNLLSRGLASCLVVARCDEETWVP